MLNVINFCCVIQQIRIYSSIKSVKIIQIDRLNAVVKENKMSRFKIIFFTCAGYISSIFIDAAEVSKCYQTKNETYCFYTDSSELSWDEAREFCERRNSTLPIITDEDVDKVFQQFIVSDSYSLIQNRPVWIGAQARPVNNSVGWHWIDGRPSGLRTDNPVVQSFLSLLSTRQ